MDHEGGKGLFLRDNKVAVFNWDGDTILSRSTRSLGNSVKDACEAITKHWDENGARRVKTAAAPVQNAIAVNNAADAKAKVSITSDPVGADIEVDGAFIGSTPSVVELAPGEHRVMVKKPGFKPWERTVRISGGSVNLAAQLEK